MHPGIDPDMRALLQEQAVEAARHPPIRLEVPLDAHRAVNDTLSMRLAAGGPDVAESLDRWVAARGRRIFCRVHRPRTDRPLPATGVFPRRRLGLGHRRYA